MQRMKLILLFVASAFLTVADCVEKAIPPAELATVVKSVESRPAPAPVVLDPPLQSAVPETVRESGMLGGERYRVKLAGADLKSRNIWIYRPDASRNAPVRCVVMAPAGSHLFDGMNLADGDTEEHSQYFYADVAVVACEVDGAIPDGQENDDNTAATGAKAFTEAKAGIHDVQAALDVAESLSWVDKKHIYVAGHSSSATLALETMAFDPRVVGCIALAPEVNVPRFVQGEAAIERAGAPGLSAMLAAVSPHNNIARLTKPLYIAVASDDEVVRPADVKTLAETLQKTNPTVSSTRLRAADTFKE